MIAKLLTAGVAGSLLLLTDACGAAPPPRNVKEAILRTVELYANRQELGARGIEGPEQGEDTFQVMIEGRKLNEGSIRVTISYPNREESRYDVVFNAEFSNAGTKTEFCLVKGHPWRDYERKAWSAIKPVLAHYLEDNKSEVSLMVEVRRPEKTEWSVLVSRRPASPGGHRWFILNDEYEIKDVLYGR